MFKAVKSAKTKEKNSITLFETQNKEYDKKILLIGVFHGEEPQGYYLLNKFMKTDLTGIKNKLLILPCLNPDGMAKNQRQNSNRVDLNRNFPTKNWQLTDKNEYFGGLEPASEIETKFIIEVLEQYKPDAIISIHAPFEIVNYDGPAKELAQTISKITAYPVQADIGYPTPGSFGNFAGVERNIPTVTLELPENVPNEELWHTNYPMLQYFAFKY